MKITIKQMIDKFITKICGKIKLQILKPSRGYIGIKLIIIIIKLNFINIWALNINAQSKNKKLNITPLKYRINLIGFDTF